MSQLRPSEFVCDAGYVVFESNGCSGHQCTAGVFDRSAQAPTVLRMAAPAARRRNANALHNKPLNLAIGFLASLTFWGKICTGSNCIWGYCTVNVIWVAFTASFVLVVVKL
jgi:hypothetical protein